MWLLHVDNFKVLIHRSMQIHSSLVSISMDAYYSKHGTCIILNESPALDVTQNSVDDSLQYNDITLMI